MRLIILFLLISCAYANFAPYVLLQITTCTSVSAGGGKYTHSCSGTALGSFAAASSDMTYDSFEDLCDTYCVDSFVTQWEIETTSAVAPTYWVGAAPATVDVQVCVKIPRKFKCFEKINNKAPLNAPSIELYAAPDTKMYYFSSMSNATCSGSVQCAAYRILKDSLLFNTKIPEPSDVNLIRGTVYSCLLSYIGASSISGAEVCFEQIGPLCYRPGNIQPPLCITSETVTSGITSGGGGDFDPSLFCGLQNEMMDRNENAQTSEYGISPDNLPYGISSCSAVVIYPETAVFDEASSVLWYNPKLTMTMKDSYTALLSMPFSCNANTTMALELIKATVVAAGAAGVIFDMKQISSSGCATPQEVSTTMQAIMTTLSTVNIYNFLVHLPLANNDINLIPISSLASEVKLFIIPGELITSSYQFTDYTPLLCQTLFNTPPNPPDAKGIMQYTEQLLASVPRNKLMLSMSMRGYIKEGATNILYGGSLEAGRILQADSTALDVYCTTTIDVCCIIPQVQVLVDGATKVITAGVMKQLEYTSLTTLMYATFGVNQFFVVDADADYKLGRENLPTVSNIAQNIKPYFSTQPILSRSRSQSVNESLISTFGIRSTNSGGNVGNPLSPKYKYGSGLPLDCPGLVSMYGNIVLSNFPYVEFKKSNFFDGIYAADITSLRSCTSGQPASALPITDVYTKLGIDVNTLIPASNPSQYIISINAAGALVEYIPPVQAVCVDVNTTPIDRLNYYLADDEFVFSEPTLNEDLHVIYIPQGTYHLMKDFKFGVDYINFNSTCIEYDLDALPSCAVTICGGDQSCINTYGSLCNSAALVVSDIRRSGQMMRDAFEALAYEEEKAAVYSDVEDGSRKPRVIGAIFAGIGIFAGLAVGGAGLAIAIETRNRVNVLEQQLDLTQNMVVEMGNYVVNVTNKLNANIELTNNRIDQLQNQANENFKMVNNNFRELNNNLQAFATDVNERFKVTFGYLSWYTQMMSVNTQMIQAAMQMKYKATNIALCMQNIGDGKMGVCPSGLAIFETYPGLANIQTVAAMLYQDRKLFIVNRVPEKIEEVYMSKVIGTPTISNGSLCWPDYDVWSYNGNFYQPGDCENRFCSTMVRHDAFYACLSNPAACVVVCGDCYKNVCYKNGEYVWDQNNLTVNMTTATPPPVFERPVFNGTVPIPDIVINITNSQLNDAINTSVVFQDVKDDITDLQNALKEYEEAYDSLTGSRDTVSIVELIILILFGVWLVILTIVLFYYACCRTQTKNETAGYSRI